MILYWNILEHPVFRNSGQLKPSKGFVLSTFTRTEEWCDFSGSSHFGLWVDEMQNFEPLITEWIFKEQNGTTVWICLWTVAELLLFFTVSSSNLKPIRFTLWPLKDPSWLRIAALKHHLKICNGVSLTLRKIDGGTMQIKDCPVSISVSLSH